ncbi:MULTISPECIES: glutaredoxin family protein [unclassified Janthinobacterium]|uniref:glutaredoxin family protein n=1 Tax=unclassified Janthinobacterium TaxID=2610881 RepID=UPI00036475B1|nr:MULTISPECIES: glutaredoxin family protein [unclassified Janthinobacterium]MEC5163356.1 glutaredoxin [Janthinobacterium sp. CG_S6]
MLSSGPTKVSLFILILATFLTSTGHTQSLGNLLKALQEASSSDTVGAIKSLADTLQGHVPPGIQAENAEGKVVLYRTAWCGYCKKAAVYMRNNNIPFVERDIETNGAYKAEYKSLGGYGAVPFLVFGQKTMHGFSETAFVKNYADFQVALAAPQPTTAGHGPLSTKGQPDGAQAGQTMMGKIPGVKVYAQPYKSAEKLLLLGKTDEVVYMGEERDGMYRVTTQKGEGWVDKLLLKKP